NSSLERCWSTVVQTSNRSGRISSVALGIRADDRRSSNVFPGAWALSSFRATWYFDDHAPRPAQRLRSSSNQKMILYGILLLAGVPPLLLDDEQFGSNPVSFASPYEEARFCSQKMLISRMIPACWGNPFGSSCPCSFADTLLLIP